MNLYAVMPERESNKVELTPQARQALEAECVLRKTNLKDLASELILSSVSEESLRFVGAQRPNNQKSKSPNVQESDLPEDSDSTPKKTRLSKNLDAIARIRELWASDPRPSMNDIARIIGYPKTTTVDFINRAIKAGELPEDQTGSTTSES